MIVSNMKSIEMAKQGMYYVYEGDEVVMLSEVMIRERGRPIGENEAMNLLLRYRNKARIAQFIKYAKLHKHEQIHS